MSPQAAEPDPPEVGRRERLDALYRTGLLDTPAEEVFDRLTTLASSLLGAPVVLLSLVDRDRQFFKSIHGLTGWAAEARETPLSHSFCKHVVGTRGPLVVADARSHPLVSDNLAIEDLGVVAYAGIPVTTDDGEVVGSFCAIDGEPRTWTEQELVVLRSIAGAALSEVRLREALNLERQSRERWERIFDSTGQAIALVDPDGRFVETNPAFLELLGYDAATLRTMTFRDVTHPEDLDSSEKEFAALEAGAASGRTPFRKRYLHRDGTVVHANVTLTRIADGPTGTEPRLVAMLQDVSLQVGAEQELEAREAQFRQIVENATDIVYLTDSDGRFVYANPAGRAAVGYSMEELRGMSWRDLVREDQRAEVKAFYAEHLRNGTLHVNRQLPLVARSGTEFWVEQHVQLLFRDGTFAGAQAIARDVTQRREVERMKNEFISVVSHELRTPLTAIRGALGLLAGGKLGDLPERAERMLEIAVQNADRLVRLINHILDLERLESGKVELELAAFDGAQLVRDAAASVDALAQEKGVELRVEAEGDEIPLLGDAHQLMQALTNLLSNAIKFSEPGSPVLIRARRAGRDVLLEVEDRGRGIPPEKQEIIFERFRQVDVSDSRDRGGTGLGLSICRTIVRAHGGEITVDSEPGRGSLFRIHLPSEPELVSLVEPGHEGTAKEERHG